ncbi:hypothetical protein [Brumimicrobium aurantiacum]|uniref:Lipoprotein n=1 Tax=Brumimicrobium aurantiacum TaxID=1737063 RepID=A0A3E1EUK5_9FLAO|nr:hypothetical protein [Brumimicrobium aurantiacum]RFC53241.1 hypothetical protein DXU93_14345 [Brumimicrobium aurantiacum]
MKKIIFFICLFTLSSCWTRIGDLTMVANKNVDSSKEYVLVAQNVEGKSKTKKGDPLESAIDAVVAEHKGNHLMNAKIFIKNNGKKVKVIGDVYGDKEISITTTISKEIILKVGDDVSFKHNLKLIKGEIIGINSDNAVIEFKINDEKKIKEIPFEDLTKLK